MIYIDTSVIVKLYVKERYSLEVSTWIKKNNQALLLTRLHDLEFINAIHLKQFREEITQEQVRLILSKFDEHWERGVYYRPRQNWTETLNIAVELARNHTGYIGSRSLDVLHVASAIATATDHFLTFDDSQARLAALAGLKVESIIA